VEDKITRREFLKKCADCGLVLGAMPFVGGLGAVESVFSNVTGAQGLSSQEALYYKQLSGGSVKCLLCPNHCVLERGQRGTCRVRDNTNGKLYTRVYGYTARVRGDAMEKGPFFHFLPGTSSVALGTVGCNLHCLYCQNWEFTQIKPEDLKPPPQYLPPASLVSQAKKYGRPTITFTYSEPVVAIEYVLETARLAKQQGIKTLVKTGAYVNPGPMAALCKTIDGINIDFKGYSDSFYRDVCGGKLDSVLEAIKTAHKYAPWLELTAMTVPGKNDSANQFRQQCQWIMKNLGPDVPLHVSRFFPSYRLRNLQATPIDKLRELRKIAYEEGLHYVYLGNLQGDPGESTYCPKCGIKMIKRIGYNVTMTGLDSYGRCTKCGLKIPGKWS
jgi:pyruvate formate lyase activating enzyme